ncbi:hypothetical protein EW145_g2108 [Phellinidium pouzarii]|uniref:Uncharacterized protein n=1 Tax=Phellinidium pouzarii TaxID=167371 RepID=A0A4S4LDY6_9AGAM|nr:hypothetical protein EW145_g2108 [Phellinidium pouzarii]
MPAPCNTVFCIYVYHLTALRAARWLLAPFVRGSNKEIPEIEKDIGSEKSIVTVHLVLIRQERDPATALA